jgi:hypothetical protein
MTLQYGYECSVKLAYMRQSSESSQEDSWAPDL